MNEMSPPAPLRLLLLGYGHVAQAFLPLLASRSEWLRNRFGVHAVISGIGTRTQGFYIHPEGIDVEILASEKQLCAGSAAKPTR